MEPCQQEEWSLMVACVQPKPMKTIADPASGTGVFFLTSSMRTPKILIK